MEPILETLIKAMDEALHVVHEHSPRADNPYEGNCYVASAALKKFFGRGVLMLYRTMDCNKQYHWWVETKDGRVIDLTAQQYELKELPVPSRSEAYEFREKQSYMKYASYKKRSQKLMDYVAHRIAGVPYDELMQSSIFPIADPSQVYCINDNESIHLRVDMNT